MTKQRMIVKDNDLIGATYSLGVAEQRVIFLAIIEAREQDKLIDAMGLLRISAKSYQNQFNVSKQTAYEALKKAVIGLFYAELEYSQTDQKTGKQAHHKIRWVEHIAYIDDAACVDLQFTSSIIPLITRLKERYTEYELKQISGLRSEYAIRLYELLSQWRSVGKVPNMTLQDLRKKLGVADDKYQEISDLKKRVIRLAISQINDNTDLIAAYHQTKTGREVTGISFTFKQKKTIEHDSAANDNGFIKLTPAQINLFSTKLAALGELGSRAPVGASTADFATLIANDLADPNKQARYAPYLAKVGYQPTKRKAKA